MAKRKHVDLIAATAAVVEVDAGVRDDFSRVVVTKHGTDAVWFTVSVGKTSPADPAVPVAKADDNYTVTGAAGAQTVVDVADARFVKVRALTATGQTVSVEGMTHIESH